MIYTYKTLYLACSKCVLTEIVWLQLNSHLYIKSRSAQCLDQEQRKLHFWDKLQQCLHSYLGHVRIKAGSSEVDQQVGNTVYIHLCHRIHDLSFEQLFQCRQEGLLQEFGGVGAFLSKHREERTQRLPDLGITLWRIIIFYFEARII